MLHTLSKLTLLEEHFVRFLWNTVLSFTTIYSFGSIGTTKLTVKMFRGIIDSNTTFSLAWKERDRGRERERATGPSWTFIHPSASKKWDMKVEAKKGTSSHHCHHHHHASTTITKKASSHHTSQIYFFSDMDCIIFGTLIHSFSTTEQSSSSSRHRQSIYHLYHNSSIQAQSIKCSPLWLWLCCWPENEILYSFKSQCGAFYKCFLKAHFFSLTYNNARV